MRQSAQFESDTDAFIDAQGLERYRGKIVPRNSGRSPWVTTVDLRLTQEIPIWRKTRGVVSLDVENLANLINNDWGQVSQVSFIYVAPVLDANRIATTGCPGGAAGLLRLPAARGLHGPDGADQLADGAELRLARLAGTALRVLSGDPSIGARRATAAPFSLATAVRPRLARLKR